MSPVIALAVIAGPHGVLLGRRADTGAWVFPGGTIEPGETPQSAAVREALEEASIAVDALRVLGVRIHPDSQAETYYVACEARYGAQAAASEELTEVRWVAPDEVDTMTAGTIWEPVRSYLRAMMNP